MKLRNHYQLKLVQLDLVDKGANVYLPGGGSQVEMAVPPAERMNYLEVIDESLLKP